MDIEEPEQQSQIKSEKAKKYMMEEERSNSQKDIFQRMLQFTISENEERVDNTHHPKTARKYNKRIDFRKILNSSSSNDRLIPSSLKHDSSRENSERAHNHFQTENSLDEESLRKSFKKHYEEGFSIENMARDSSSQFSERSWSRSSIHQILPPECAQNKEEEIIEQFENKICCNCKKSKCLKLYCQCFQRQLLCNERCKCYDCGNRSSNTEEHKKAIMQALARNAHGFEDQNFQNSEQKGFSLGVQIQQVIKGCKCKRTHCVKKYCQCYNNNKECGVFCRCEDCKNTSYHHHKRQISPNPDFNS